MPRPGHRLDLLLLPEDPLRPLNGAALDGLFAAWTRAGLLDPDGRPGPRASGLVEGGFGLLRLDAPGRLAFYANQVGGFAVACPECGASVVPAFNAAMTAWRAGGDRDLVCPACGAQRPLEALSFRPDAAFAHWAVVFADAAAPALTRSAQQALVGALGPLRPILRRPG